MIVRDRNGMVRNVEDGQAMTIYNEIHPINGHVMTFKGNAWLKIQDRGRVEFLMFGRHMFVPQGSSDLAHTSWRDIPARETKWEVGATYRHRLFHERGYFELIHEEGAWVTFRRVDVDGHFKTVHTGRKSEHTQLERVASPFKTYDPSQQPFDDGDV